MPRGVLKELGVERTSSGAPSSRAIANFVEVLPKEPVTATTTGATDSSFALARRMKRALTAR
jgi:hypothetical protein